MFLCQLEPLAYRRMDFEEFCAAAISPYQLEALESWEDIAGTAFQHFEQEGNRVILIEELAQVFIFSEHHLNEYMKRSPLFLPPVDVYVECPGIFVSIQELNLAPTHYSIVQDWIRKSDGKLNFLGFTKFLHGVTIRGSNTRRH
jgi:hypothetical protein